MVQVPSRRFENALFDDPPDGEITGMRAVVVDVAVPGSPMVEMIAS